MNTATQPQSANARLRELIPFATRLEPFEHLAKFMEQNPGMIPIIERVIQIMPIIKDTDTPAYTAGWVAAVLEFTCVMYNSPIPIQQPMSSAGKELQTHIRARY